MQDTAQIEELYRPLVTKKPVGRLYLPTGFSVSLFV